MFNNRSKIHQQSKIGSKLRNANVVLFVLVAMVMLVMSYFVIRQVAHNVAQDYARLYSTRVTGILNAHLNREIALMTDLTHSDAITQWFADEADDEKKQRAFSEMRSTMELIYGQNLYFGVNESLNEYSFEDTMDYQNFTPYARLSPTRFEDLWYFECAEAQTPYVLNVDIDKLTNRKRVWLNHKVEQDGKFLGVMATGLMFDQVLEELFGTYDSNTIHTVVIDDKGIVQMDSNLLGDDSMVIYNNDHYVHEYSDDDKFDAIINAYLKKNSGFHVKNVEPEIIHLQDSNFQYASYAPINQTNWSVVTFYNTNSLFTISELWPLFLIIIGLFVLYTTITNYLNRKWLIDPFSNLVESLAKVDVRGSNEELDIVGIDRSDEYGDLARTISDLLAQLDSYNNQLVRATATAESASRSKSDFLANMSHEIRTPINAIVGMTHIGRTATEVERKDYCLEKINDASAHLLGVINDILDMSKIEADKLELSAVWFDFERMLQKVSSVITFRAGEKNIDFVVHLDHRIPPLLEGDDQRLSQVLTNLLGNAVKFTPEGGTVTLNAFLLERQDDLYTIRMEISDTGIGIASENIDKLFNSFEQADSGTSRKFGGTGLGLAISKRIVELMDGRIGVDSVLGEGSTFYFEFSVHGKRDVTRLEGIDIKGVRILAVDDDPSVLAFFAEVAGQFGVLCDTALSPDDALAAVEKYQGYDLYFIDYNLPTMNGVELTKKIRTLVDGDPTIIMISGLDRADLKEEFERVGISQFLAKPLFPSYILDSINENQGSQMKEDAGDDVDQQITFPGAKILLIEDVAINREIFRAMVSPMMITVEDAENGKIGLEKFSADPAAFDLIMMDVQMPEMDGYEATRAIRKLSTPRAETIPIVAMTANVFKEDIERALAAGMNDHLGKPIDYGMLLQTLQKYLGKQDN